MDSAANHVRVLAIHLRTLLENGTIPHPTSIVIEADVVRAEQFLAESDGFSPSDHMERSR